MRLFLVLKIYLSMLCICFLSYKKITIFVCLNTIVMNKPKLNLIYIFVFSVEAPTVEIGIKKALPTIRKCEEFAASLDILVACDHIGSIIDGEFEVRVRVNIKGSQNASFVKVSALFAFASSLKLILCNQVLLSDK